MFLGEEHRNIDPKGRLMIPPQFREVAKDMGSENEVVLVEFDDCVCVYPFPVWNEIAKSFLNVNVLDPVMLGLQRQFFSKAAKVGFDKQGRILVPSGHRKYAQLEKEVTIIGVGRRFEIWNKEIAEQRSADTQANMGANLASLADKGLTLQF